MFSINPLLRLCGAAFVFLALAVHGQSYPTKPIRLIVPFAPAGSTDVTARIVAQKLSEAWRQQVVVDNRAGAGGNIGAEAVAKSAGDGYTLLLATTGVMAINHRLYRNLPFDALRDFAPITQIGALPLILVVHPSLPAKSVKDLVAALRANPGKLTYGHAGIGSQTHLAAENFLNAAKADAVAVPYKGEGPALAGLVGGDIAFTVTNVAATLPHISSGRVRALGVTSKTEAPQLPGVPPVAQTLPGFENTGWFGIVAPTGTPKEIIDKVYRDTKKALEASDLRARLYVQGLAPVGNTPAEMGKAMKEETALWARVVRERNIKVQ